MEPSSIHPLVAKIGMGLSREGFAEPGDRILVGLSGGPDSVALLHGLLEASTALRFPLDIAACHLNHRLRGEESDLDEAFSVDLASKLGIPLSVESIDVERVRKERGGSIETVARTVRYDFYRRAASRHDSDKVALGHHRDDQAETVLMRIARGAGLRGLRGMPVARRLDPEGILLIRPLLGVSRAEILDFLEARRLPFREDRSNAELGSSTRNRVRHRVLPEIAASLGVDPAESLSRLASIAGEAHALIERLAAEAFDRSAKRTGDSEIGIRRGDLLALDRILQHAVLEKALDSIGRPTPEFEECARILEAITSGAPGPLDLKGGVKLEVEGEEILLYRVSEAAASGGPGDRAHHPVTLVPIPGSVVVPELSIRFDGEIAIAPLDPASPEWAKEGVEAFASDELPRPLRVRTWRSGDRIRIAPGKSKKLQDLFVDAKIPKRRRHRTALLVDAADEILWAVGVRRAAGRRVNETTREAVVIRVTDSRGQSL